MKVVKLNKTHKLFSCGYTHGVRFDYRGYETTIFLNQLIERFGGAGDRWTYYRSRKGRPFWIGFKDEKALTFALMLQ